MPVGFYLWQVVRVTLFFYVVFAFAREEFQRQAIFEGLAVGLVLEAILCVWQRLVENELQATGSFGHQNIFGMTVNLALIPLLGLFLSQRDGRSRLVFLGVASGLLCAALTVSRATVGLAALGTVAVLAVSTMKAYTVRKMRALLLLSFLAAILLPIITISFNTRFEKSSPSSTYDERGAFETAAVMIARAHPFGIGANNFVVIANAEGYYERAGVIPTHESRAAHVHNVYLLTAAENGWLALIAVCIVLVGSIVAGWKRLSKTGSAMDLHIALIVSVGLVSLHSLFEWVLVVDNPQYALAIVLGLLVQSTQATYTASQSAVADSRLPRR
jgi:O-antigen ligase